MGRRVGESEGGRERERDRGRQITRDWERTRVWCLGKEETGKRGARREK